MRRARLALPALALILTFILIATSGCAGVGFGPRGPIRTEELSIDYPATDEPVNLVLNFGAADFNAQADGDGRLLTGTVRYNVAGLRPAVYQNGSEVTVEQSTNVTPVNMINEWDIRFGTQRPIELEVNAGAYDGNWDMGGVPLQRLTVNQGASRSTFDFSRPNPTEMTHLQFRTGAASLEMLNLANANFETMNFEGGASSYTLDFGGQLERDAEVTVTAGVSDLTVVIPSDMPVQVTVNQTITAVNVDPEFSSRGRTYFTPAWGNAPVSPNLSIEVTLGLGNVNLRLSPPQGSTI